MMRPNWGWCGAAIALTAAMPAPAQAATPREMLVEAVFATRDKATALAGVERAHAAAAAVLAREPGDQEASIIQATATGYRAKLTGNRGTAIAARRQFESLATRFPRNPETHLALGAWHIGVIATYGRIAGRMAVGAQKGVGVAELDRAVALGGNRAMFAGLASLLRLELDASDARGRELAEAATRGTTPTAIDRIMQRATTAILASLRKDGDKATQALADRLLPLGQIPK